MKENESKEDNENRQLVYELTGIRDESLHIQPYADMIDKLTYVQKADFAKRALELERDCVTYKKMFEEVSRERNAWISEYRAARQEVEGLKQEKKQIIEANAAQALQITLLQRDINEYTTLYREYKDRYEFTLGRANALEEWLSEYRDELKKTNVYHKNQAIINAINELLNEND